MIKGGKNAMITENDESTKGDSSKKNLGKESTKWYFPQLQRSVVAETFEEAQEIINKEIVE